MICKICQEYHERKHPYEKTRKKWAQNAKKVNLLYTKEKRRLAGIKAYQTRLKNKI